MAIYKRGGIYWFAFWWNGERIQKSTKIRVGTKRNRKDAEDVEAAYRTALAKGELGLLEKKPVPTLKEFVPRFFENASTGRRRAPRESTLTFYAFRLASLLKYEPLATANLDKISPELINSYVSWRKPQVSPTCINRELGSLRRLLHVARQLGIISRVPTVAMLEGERERQFVLSPEQERNYLEFAPQPLKDVGALMLDTGLRVGEAVSLEWKDAYLESGYLQVAGGKSRNARRTIPLTSRVKAMLERRKAVAKSEYVFTDERSAGPLSRSTVSHQHTKLKRSLKLSDEFVVHSFRHTMLTRLGAAGADAYTIKKLAGHCSVSVSEKYIHPQAETVTAAFERFERLASTPSAARVNELPEGPKGLPPATLSATVEGGDSPEVQ